MFWHLHLKEFPWRKEKERDMYVWEGLSCRIALLSVLLAGTSNVPGNSVFAKTDDCINWHNKDFAPVPKQVYPLVKCAR